MLPRHHPFRRTFPCLACIGSSANVKSPLRGAREWPLRKIPSSHHPQKIERAPRRTPFSMKRRKKEKRVRPPLRRSTARRQAAVPCRWAYYTASFPPCQAIFACYRVKKILIRPISAHNIVNIENRVIVNSFLFPLTLSPARWYNTCIIRAHAGSSSFWHPAREECFHDI